MSEASRLELTTDWSIEIEPAFAGRVVDGDLQLVDPGPPVRTVWLSIWGAPPDGDAAKLMADIKAESNPAATQKYEEAGSEPIERRFASWYPEKADGRDQWSLYAYTVRPDSYVQAAFILDDPAGLDWALATWRSLRHKTS
jgi:hypothetical protein